MKILAIERGHVAAPFFHAAEEREGAGPRRIPPVVLRVPRFDAVRQGFESLDPRERFVPRMRDDGNAADSANVPDDGLRID